MMEDNKKDDLNVEEIKLEISYDDEDGNNNLYACEKCPTTFESKKKLNEHTKRIHHEKKIICPTCGFEVFGSNNFYNHKRKHKEKAKCPICEKEFRVLAKHMENNSKSVTGPHKKKLPSREQNIFNAKNKRFK